MYEINSGYDYGSAGAAMLAESDLIDPASAFPADTAPIRESRGTPIRRKFTAGEVARLTPRQRQLLREMGGQIPSENFFRSTYLTETVKG